MRIAVLGWGSLIPEIGELRIVDDAWNVGGPELPIELSRLSQRRGYLTYVIDEAHKRRVPTRYAISVYDTLEDAIANLANRAGCPSRSIGYVRVTATGRYRSRTPMWQDIREWLRHEGLDAAIWTDLGPRFKGEFTLERGLAFWQALPADKLEGAKQYARQAPEEVDTDFRRLLRAKHLLT